MARGRPKSFEPQKVLDRAVDELWREGVRGLSLNDLSRRLQVGKPALAAMFGGKDELIRSALLRYHEATLRAAASALEGASTPRDVAAAHLAHARETLLGQNEPRGCFIASATSECGARPGGPLTETLAQIRKEQIDLLAAAFNAAGDQRPDESAVFLYGLAQALANLARGGASREQISLFTERAIEAFGPGRYPQTIDQGGSGRARRGS